MKRISLVILICLALGLVGCAAVKTTTPVKTTAPAKSTAAQAKPTATAAAVSANSAVITTPPPEPVSLPTGTPIPPTFTPMPLLPTATAVPPSATSEPSVTTTLPPAATAQPGLAALPAKPQRIEFASEDGTRLVGRYYPAAVNPAPVIVLMHWAGGDKNDWVYVGMAAWLQNRGLEIPTPPATLPFDTPYVFTLLPTAQSYNIFLFDFRNFGESAPSNQSFSQSGPLWQADARAAYAKARTLPGVDPDQVVGIGASIGADAVVDACGEGCLGALSLGPGNYLDVSYQEAVSILDQAGKPVWCVGAEDDAEAAQACRAASGEHYQLQIYAAGGHAMRLFRAEINLQPALDSVIVDFLKLVLNP